MSTYDFDTVFAAYVQDTMVCEPIANPPTIALPGLNTVMAEDDVRAILDDPRILYQASNRSSMRAADTLLTFAIWLHTAPTARIPAGYESRAARMKFALWSLPHRHQWAAYEPYSDYYGFPDGFIALVSSVVNNHTAWEAQQQWKQYVDQWEDDPWLAAGHSAGDSTLETSLRWLHTTWPDRGDKWPAPAAPLILRGTQDQHRVADDIAEHWLERSAPWQAARALHPRSALAPILTALATVPTALVVTIMLAGFGNIARWAAVFLIGTGLVAAIRLPRRYLVLGLLRLPASTAVGLILLLTLTPRWWVSPKAWQVGAAMLAVAAGYLMIEARQHGAARPAAVLRGLGLTVVGALIAATLSIAMLGFVAPRLAEHGDCLNGWWDLDPWHAMPLNPNPSGPPPDADSCAKATRSQNAAAPAATLLLMTGWSFGFGLSAQILWDDRPVTAPLGRLRRTRGHVK